jgi:hypothetical protein
MLRVSRGMEEACWGNDRGILLDNSVSVFLEKAICEPELVYGGSKFQKNHGNLKGFKGYTLLVFTLLLPPVHFVQ